MLQLHFYSMQFTFNYSVIKLDFITSNIALKLKCEKRKEKKKSRNQI